MTSDHDPQAFITDLDREGKRHDVALEGSHVTWRRFGNGPALVLLHGGHGSWLHWARNIRSWCSSHTLWVPDLPGYGDSGSPVEPTLTALVESVTITLDTLVGKHTPVALAGFSFGGLVAAKVAEYRGSVTRLALLGPGGHGGARRPRGELRSWHEAADRRDDPALAEVMRHNLMMHMLHDAESVDELALRIHTDACMRTRFRSKPISRAGGLAGSLDHHHGPLLLVWGENDVTAVPDEAARSLCHGRERCRTQVVPGAGHWVQYERAEAVNRLLPAWLEATKPAEVPAQHS